jgi:hypothetical protein
MKLPEGYQVICYGGTISWAVSKKYVYIRDAKGKVKLFRSAAAAEDYCRKDAKAQS